MRLQQVNTAAIFTLTTALVLGGCKSLLPQPVTPRLSRRRLLLPRLRHRQPLQILQLLPRRQRPLRLRQPLPHLLRLQQLRLLLRQRRPLLRSLRWSG